MQTVHAVKCVCFCVCESMCRCACIHVCVVLVCVLVCCENMSMFLCDVCSGCLSCESMSVL